MTLTDADADGGSQIAQVHPPRRRRSTLQVRRRNFSLSLSLPLLSLDISATAVNSI